MKYRMSCFVGVWEEYMSFSLLTKFFSIAGKTQPDCLPNSLLSDEYFPCLGQSVLLIVSCKCFKWFLSSVQLSTSKRICCEDRTIKLLVSKLLFIMSVIMRWAQGRRNHYSQERNNTIIGMQTYTVYLNIVHLQKSCWKLYYPSPPDKSVRKHFGITILYWACEF